MNVKRAKVPKVKDEPPEKPDEGAIVALPDPQKKALEKIIPQAEEALLKVARFTFYSLSPFWSAFICNESACPRCTYWLASYTLTLIRVQYRQCRWSLHSTRHARIKTLSPRS